MKKIILVCLLLVSACAVVDKQPPEGFWSVENGNILFCFKVVDKSVCSQFPKQLIVESNPEIYY